MGYGAGGCFAVRINESVVKKHCPKLLKEFKDLVAEHGEYKVSSFLDSGDSYDFDDDVSKEIEDAHTALCEAFEKKTGLEIQYFYHDSENDGDRYDDIGEAWIVHDAYELTKEAKPYAKHISYATFVQYG